ncbi:hypothetical protein V7O66_04615 [Methanolobus sp. ZRKC3]|uniref:hypothetical protein n=1 Tax=Methanolobus sp. ZRKC3 TaxID=3125786 RepID=UPI003247D3A9
MELYLLLKARKLAQYLVGERKSTDFSNPAHVVKRQDSEDQHYEEECRGEKTFTKEAPVQKKKG